jgi:peroxiredoxin family protein
MVFLHDARFDRVYQAVSLVATASRLGRRAYLCLFYDALAAYVQGSWDDPGTLTGDEWDALPWRGAMARGFDALDAPSPTEMLNDARLAGNVTLFACSTSVRVLGIEPAELMPRVDAIVGLATMLEAAGDDAQTLYL